MAQKENERQRKLIEDLRASNAAWWKARDVAETALTAAVKDRDEAVAKLEFERHDPRGLASLFENAAKERDELAELVQTLIDNNPNDMAGNGPFRITALAGANAA